MMKKLLALLIVGCGALWVYSSVHAADVHLSWDASEGATGYKIYMSTDQMASWDTGTDVGNVTDYVITNVPDTGLILFRCSAYNAHGEAIRYDAGLWYCGDCNPPMALKSLGVE